MKPVSQFEAKYKPLYEGARMSTFKKGHQFRLYEGDYEAGFLTQHNVSFFALHMRDGTSMTFFSSVDVKNYLMRVYTDYTYKDMN